MNGQIQYGLFRPMTSAATLDATNLALPRRLATFRLDLLAVARCPTRAALEQITSLMRNLDLHDYDVVPELEELRACAAALDLADDIEHDNLPVAATGHTLPAGDVCHFATPVHFGRRRTDQFGHLELTNDWLTFRAALDLSVSWSEVSDVQRSGREVIVTLADSTRLLRFWCPCLDDAARAAVLAAHFSGAARGRGAAADSAYHAWA